MSGNPEHVPIPGSSQEPVGGACAVGAPNPSARIEVTVMLRPRPSSKDLASPDIMSAQLPKDRQYVSREAFEAEYGADASDLSKVEAFAKEYGLDVVEADAGRRSVKLAGTTEAMGRAFGVNLKNYDSPQGAYRGHTGPVHVPAELSGIVTGVFGLDNRPQARPRDASEPSMER